MKVLKSSSGWWLKKLFFELEKGNLLRKGLSGKSTILKSIVGLIGISSGDIKINGVSIKTKKIFDIYESIGMVFEKDALFDSLKVW